MSVAESQWVKVSLQSGAAVGKAEGKNALELTEMEIDGKHFFCESRDVTRPFPSPMPVDRPDLEFVWNRWFSMSFRAIGLPHHCVNLLQASRRFFFIEDWLVGSTLID